MKKTRQQIRDLARKGKRAVVFEFDISLDDRLRDVAKRTGTSKSEIVRTATAAKLDALEAA